MNKKWWLVTISGLAMVLAMPFLAGCSSPAVDAQGTAVPVQVSQQPQGIWVSGIGEVSVTSDLATLNLGVVAQEANVAQAQSEASDAMAKVMQALTNSGIAQKDIQTGYFSINQRTTWDNIKQTETTTGYQVTNMVTVKIRDTNKVSNIIESVVQAGGDFIRINGINFSVEDPAQYYQEARAKAMEAAKNKADELAKLAGVTLGRPTYIAENAQYTPTYNNYANFSMAIPAPVVAGTTTPISAGETRITLSVQVAYSVIQ